MHVCPAPRPAAADGLGGTADNRWTTLAHFMPAYNSTPDTLPGFQVGLRGVGRQLLQVVIGGMAVQLGAAGWSRAALWHSCLGLGGQPMRREVTAASLPALKRTPCCPACAHPARPHAPVTL